MNLKVNITLNIEQYHFIDKILLRSLDEQRNNINSKAVPSLSDMIALQQHEAIVRVWRST